MLVKTNEKKREKNNDFGLLLLTGFVLQNVASSFRVALNKKLLQLFFTGVNNDI